MNKVRVWGLVFGLTILGTDLYALGEDIKTFQADFTQIIRSEDELRTHNQENNGYEQISYQGNIKAKIPNLAKWTYIQPMVKEIFIIAKKIVVYEPNLYQATVVHLKEETDFLSILKQAKPQSNEKYVSRVGKTSYLLTIKDGKPISIEFEDEFNNEILITFSNVSINTPVEDKSFVFIPKEGIDIIEH